MPAKKPAPKKPAAKKKPALGVPCHVNMAATPGGGTVLFLSLAPVDGGPLISVTIDFADPATRHMKHLDNLASKLREIKRRMAPPKEPKVKKPKPAGPAVLRITGGQEE